MFLEIVLICCVGMLCGTLTGLIPGLHVNTVAVLLLAFSAPLTTILSPVYISLFILSMGLTHTFIDVIPSTFLGIPDASTYLLVLPAHRFVLEGKGVVAVQTAIRGSFLSLLLTLVSIPVLVVVLEPILESIDGLIALILLVVLSVIVIRQPTVRAKVLTLLFYGITGVMGFLCFSSQLIKEPLLPLLTGFFGVSGVVLSLREKTTIPYQYPHETESLPAFTELLQSLKAFISGGMTGVLPGLSSSQAALIDSMRLPKGLLGKKENKDQQRRGHSEPLAYLFLLGGINTVNFIFSIIGLYVMSIARNGAIIAVQQFVPELNQVLFFIAIIIVFCVGSCAAVIGLRLMVVFSRCIRTISYRSINYGLLVFLILMVGMLSGWIGLLILLISTSVGILCARYRIPKTTLMGCILLPVIFYLW